MYSQEALSLIKIAQLNPADRSQVVRRLWNIHEKSLMKYAVRLSRTMEPDFAMKGMNDAARRDFLMGEVYETFDDVVMLYDPSHKASFVTYLYNKVYWRFHDEKCTNSERADREVSCDKMSFEEGMTEDEILSMCAYGRDENEDLTNGDVNDDIEYIIELKELMSTMLKALGGAKELQDFCEAHLATLERCDRYEESETAKALDCTRATVYNRLKAIRKLLVEKGIDKEFRYFLAA